jgi:hypothetical protein
MSGLPFRSKLAPYEGEIFELRRQRPPVSYREIVVLLKERHGVDVTINGVFVFLKTRRKWDRQVSVEKKTAVSESAPQPSSGSRQGRSLSATTEATSRKPRQQFSYTPSDRYNLTRLTPEQVDALEKQFHEGEH